MYKKGITLITLVITIIVILILAGTTLAISSGIVGRTNLAKFGEELKTIEDSIKEYYISYGVMPIIDEPKYTAQQLISLNTLGRDLELQAEIANNKDETSVFYLIDYAALEMKLQDRGLSKTSDDVFVVSSATNKVYYVQGVEISGNIYFSNAYITNNTIIE